MKIFCVGRNYADHARELKNDIPDEPVIFMKPDTALLRPGEDFFMPSFSQDVHHEIELVLKVCKEGKNIDPKFASRYYDQVSVGLDFTARDLQAKLKAKGLPWEISKAFNGSAAIGQMVEASTIDQANAQITLFKNGQQVQQGSTADLLFDFNQIIAYISRFFTLRKGDLIYTGTPQGVGPVAPGDVLTGQLNGQQLFELKVR